MKMIDYSYASSFDGVAPLRALAAYAANGTPKPLMVCMHSYGGDRRMMANCLAGRAEKGMFAIAPDMRGRAESAGRRDDGGVEIADIYDAIQAAIRQFPAEIDSSQIHIAGWSGGGGNVYQAFVKMPDLFASAQAFYGIADYTFLAESTEDWMRQISMSIGQSPAEAPVRYLARNAIEAAGNNRATPLHLFWDEEESICPPAMNRRFIAQAQSLGMTNVHAYESRVGDVGRWFHGAEVRGDLAEAIYEPRIMARAFPPPPALTTGSLLIPGFVITQHFTFWLGTGENSIARLDFEWRTNRAEFQLSGAKASGDARGWVRFPRFREVVRVRVNDKPHSPLVQRTDEPLHDYLYNIGLNDRITLEW